MPRAIPCSRRRRPAPGRPPATPSLASRVVIPLELAPPVPDHTARAALALARLSKYARAMSRVDVVTLATNAADDFGASCASRSAPAAALIHAAKNARETIPIVMVGAGFIATLPVPAGTSTGLTFHSGPEIVANSRPRVLDRAEAHRECRAVLQRLELGFGG